MAQDHRIIGANGQRLPFTCENRWYRTNINKGEAHSPLSQNRGGVSAAPLVNHGGYSLWLEHVAGDRSRHRGLLAYVVRAAARWQAHDST
jgi:hypothetical protein